jgi:uncharacterized protein involved in exopolysaccharide biosynthesis
MNLEQLLEYTRIHLISLNQDIAEIAAQMEQLDENSKDYKELDFEYNFLSGQIHGISYIMDVAKGNDND